MKVDDMPALCIGLPSGVRAEILPFGATLHSLQVPDRSGVLGNVLVGLPDPNAYKRQRSFRGATIGRFANRIAGAGFTLNGERHTLSANEPPNCLHGGTDGFDRRKWEVVAHWMSALTLRLESPDGDQGFPGALSVEADFVLTPPATLSITYRATVSRACPVSLTSHGFFNLSDGGPIDDYMLQISAQHFLPVDTALLPAGAPQSVSGTEFDFREAKVLLRRKSSGYDHCFCLEPTEELREIATLYDPKSGRELRLSSDQTGLQLYTDKRADAAPAVCLEPQAWPDAPNRPDFPDAVLRPGETYLNRIEFAFSTRDN
ncbi:aldose epimerase family protein [Thioclava pacifica]|uniref:Aldose 1-epimerase n=1 Tax=Thioclava pacifica DSM 10166 TaxID=1353537 RepID=A0A074JTG3_9RHOB|nr:aldose epimerase family protein [Thioclava pacifica]KEO52612.1 hypothetical protein TP2_06650 [Thioclava pacifica DSM 10166]